MKLVRASEVPAQEVREAGAERVTVRWLLSGPEGAPNFAMRLFELEPGGSTPPHEHPWEHEVFMVEGRAEVVGEEGPVTAEQGDAVLVMPNERHQFRNSGQARARFLCMIPLPE
jgi:quercetin dioxygenase-like cupin family protein